MKKIITFTLSGMLITGMAMGQTPAPQKQQPAKEKSMPNAAEKEIGRAHV